jgi:hypothetical protein
MAAADRWVSFANADAGLSKLKNESPETEQQQYARQFAFHWA